MNNKNVLCSFTSFFSLSRSCLFLISSTSRSSCLLAYLLITSSRLLMAVSLLERSLRCSVGSTSAGSNAGKTQRQKKKCNLQSLNITGVHPLLHQSRNVHKTRMSLKHQRSRASDLYNMTSLSSPTELDSN